MGIGQGEMRWLMDHSFDEVENQLVKTATLDWESQHGPATLSFTKKDLARLPKDPF